MSANLDRKFSKFPSIPVNNDIRGLLNSVNDGSTSAFMWEWFTTKPFVDAGEARFVSSFLVKTPDFYP